MSARRGDDRRKRQAKQSNVQQAKADLDRTKDDAARKIEEAKDHREHTKYLADKAEHRAERHVERMRSGYAEGAKLFFDSFKTQATLTTGSILVIVALSEGVLKTNAPYRPLLWFSFASLLFSMLAALRTMDTITVNVFETLTRGEKPPPVTPEDQVDAQARQAEEEQRATALERRSEQNLTILTRRSRAASSSFYAGIGAFAIFVVLPPLVDLVGIAVAIIGVIVAALVLGAVFFKRF